MSRISYRNYPTLQYLKDPYKGFTEYPSFRFSKDKIHYIQGSMTFFENPYYAPTIWTASKNFIEASSRAQTSLKSLILRDAAEKKLVSYSGVYILGNTVYFYVFAFCDFGKPDICFIIETDAKGTLLNYAHTSIGGMYGDDNILHSYGVKGLYKGLTEKEYMTKWTWHILGLIAFKKYAQVEIVESKARTKIHAQGCKYLNETDLDIEYLDSKWFTSLVNSKGFKVGGHFRLQPKKKEGEWTKELIWINDFEKKGYNRKAGILND